MIIIIILQPPPTIFHMSFRPSFTNRSQLKNLIVAFASFFMVHLHLFLLSPSTCDFHYLLYMFHCYSLASISCHVSCQIDISSSSHLLITSMLISFVRQFLAYGSLFSWIHHQLWIHLIPPFVSCILFFSIEAYSQCFSFMAGVLLFSWVLLLC